MKRPWLDTHVHVSAWGSDGERRGEVLGDLLDVLDRCDADLRVVLSADVPEVKRMMEDPSAIREGNSFIHDLARHAPGRLYGSCVVNPHFLEESLRIMDLCFGEWGFVQLGEMLQYIMDYRMNSDPVAKLVRRAVDFEVPVQVHISTSNSRQGPFASGVEELEDLLGLVGRVPEAKYILAHFVGTPIDNPPIADVYLDVIEKRCGAFPESLWIEIRDFNSPGVQSVLTRVPSNRIIVGTDWVSRIGPPFLPYGIIFGVTRPEENPYPPTVSALVEFLRQAGATEEVAANIGFRNAAALLRL